VMKVLVEDAYAFAQCLGGNLPTTDEWDTASRCFHAGRGLGPYQPCEAPWEGKVSVERTKELGPAERRTGKMDYVEIEEFGEPNHHPRIWEMAGNGKEWTRSIWSSPKVVPLPKDLARESMVTTRGQTYLTQRPLRYEDFDPNNPNGLGGIAHY